MTGIVIERHGYASASLMIADLVTDMVANGFTLSYQTFDSTGWNAANVIGATTFAPYRVILEAGSTIDPLNAGNANSQPWRICFDVQAPEVVFAHAATPTQLPNTGVIAVQNILSSWTAQTTQGTKTIRQMTPYDVVGSIGAQMSTGGRPNTNADSQAPGYAVESSITSTGLYVAPDWHPGQGQSAASDNPPMTAYVDEPTKGFVNRARRVQTLGASYPLTYRLVLTPRGMWLGCWEEASTQETSANFNWMLIQRPVDRTTGQVLTTGKAPVFCVNAIGGLHWQFVVRENDILRPGKRRAADTDAEDSETILNTGNQVSLSEDGKYIVTFPSRLNTSRYRYPHELDMIGTTSADVVSQFTDVPLTVYGEAQPRTYKALQSTGASGTGMRLLVLSQGGGIS